MRAISDPVGPAAGSLAARQHGVVSRRQLLAIGLSPSTIQLWLRAGRLHRLHRGVYALGHAGISREGRWLAAVLACGSGVFLSHGPAEQLQGIVARRERFALHVSVTGRASRSPGGVITHRPRSLEPGDTTVRLAIPVTTATRTVWDLAATMTPLATRRAFEQAEKLGVLDRDRLRSLLTAAPNRTGAGAIRELLAERPVPLGETRSRLEEVVFEVCHDHSLPLPAATVPLLGYEVDFLWPRARFVVEADGGDHLIGARRLRDNERDLALARAGYLVRRYTALALADRTGVAAEIAAVLTERER